MQAEADRAKGSHRNSVKIVALLDRGLPGACGKIGITRGTATVPAHFAYPHKKSTAEHDLPKKKAARFGQIRRFFTCLHDFNG
jgi:hypothetical protein